MITCARTDCGVEFQPRKHNQKYCSTECCRIETNKRIMRNYHDKRAQRQGATRVCEECETTKLSRYNDSTVCGPCSLRKSEESRMSVLNTFAAVAWQ